MEYNEEPLVYNYLSQITLVIAMSMFDNEQWAT